MSPDSSSWAPPSERADAARNREAVLSATRRLISAAEGRPVSADQIAAEAGVGKGTVFRRFGDLNGLIEAALAPAVTALREAVESGPPPVGPGAEPTTALHAYLDALFDFSRDNRALIRALEQRRPHAYYANPVSQFWITELRRRIESAIPDADARYLAVAVFTNVRADVVDYQHRHERMSLRRIRQGLHSLLSR